MHECYLLQVGMRDDSGVVVMGKKQQQQQKARQTWVAGSGPHVAMEPFCFMVVEAVDDDLYEVPSDMLCSKSIRRVCNVLLPCMEYFSSFLLGNG